MSGITSETRAAFCRPMGTRAMQGSMLLLPMERAGSARLSAGRICVGSLHDVWTETKSEIAREAEARIGALYDIEREITGRPADVRLSVRQQQSKPKVEASRIWAEPQLARLPGKGNLAKAFRYGRSRGPPSACSSRTAAWASTIIQPSAR